MINPPVPLGHRFDLPLPYRFVLENQGATEVSGEGNVFSYQIVRPPVRLKPFALKADDCLLGSFVIDAVEMQYSGRYASAIVTATVRCVEEA